jgi:2-polyprenyl-3-methyl-5-hydroxy-6-metoxy-1,4-benzoquinol methylase
MPTTTNPVTHDPEALVVRLFGSMLAGIELLSVELGRRLGLYSVLAEAGPLDASGLAARAGIAERYAREWLEQQAAAGFLVVATDGEPDARRFELPREFHGVFVDATDPLHFAGGAMMLAGAGLTLPAVAAAYRSGGGVPYEDFGPEVRGGISALNRPGFLHDMRSWIDTMPDLAARLDDGALVLDAGCGEGWSSIGLAQAFPRARVVGVDLDAASIAQARLHDRIWFVEANSSDESTLRSRLDEDYALVTVFEALHDMGDPVGALASFRGVLAPGGAVLVADEKVGAAFTAPADELDRLNYAFSVLHCLPATMAESTEYANGTVLRPATVVRWATEAGFTSTDELPVEHDFWRFYRIS